MVLHGVYTLCMPTNRRRIGLLPETDAQLEIWKQAASLERRKLPDWIRVTLDDAARKIVNQANHPPLDPPQG